MESKKRERAANFITAEVELLLGLVDKYKQIVENKKNDAVTNRAKDTAWKKIESSFNSCGISDSIRTWKTLKLKYEGIKKSIKKKSSVQRQEMYRTEEGPSNAPDFKVEEKVLSICSNITGLEARHDSDTIRISEVMKIGFIGGGRLAFALANGFITAGLAKPDEITASVHPSDIISADAFKKLGATAVFENKPVVERSEVVIVSVKPDVVVPALKDIRDLQACKNKLFISVAMGVSTQVIEQVLPLEARVIRVMPNTPALVQHGAAALSRGSRATADDAKLTTQLFKAVGTCDEVPEYQMDAVTALSGSGPAYVYMLIESMADGGVRCGLPRDLALRLAAQTTLGSAAMLQTGTHPAVLKDNVTSPAGSTADGTYFLEQKGFRAAVIGAVSAAAERCKVVNKQLNSSP